MKIYVALTLYVTIRLQSQGKEFRLALGLFRNGDARGLENRVVTKGGLGCILPQSGRKFDMVDARVVQKVSF